MKGKLRPTVLARVRPSYLAQASRVYKALVFKLFKTQQLVNISYGWALEVPDVARTVCLVLGVSACEHSADTQCIWCWGCRRVSTMLTHSVFGVGGAFMCAQC